MLLNDKPTKPLRFTLMLDYAGLKLKTPYLIHMYVIIGASDLSAEGSFATDI